MNETPTVFVDLIEVQPLTFEEHSDRYRGFTDPEARYREYRDQFQPWRWVARNADNQKKMARSPDRYFNRQDCLDAIEELFVNATVFLREAEHGDVLLRMAVER